MAWRSTRCCTGSGTGHRDTRRTLDVAGVQELDRVLVDRVARTPGEELLQRDPRLEPGDRRAQAHVRTVPEGEDARVGARDVELVGPVELARIAVPRAEQEHDLGACG